MTSDALGRFAVAFARQRVFTILAHHLAEHINGADAEALVGQNLVPVLERELYRRFQPQQVTGTLRRYVGCFSPDDFDTILARTMERLNPDKRDILARNHLWLRGQVAAVWKRLLEMAGG